MPEIFMNVMNMSYQAVIVICVLVLVRGILLFVKAPKKYAYYLWGIAFVRMICPFQFESNFSVMPKETTPVKTDILYEQSPQIHTAYHTVNQAVNAVLPEAEPTASMNPMQMVMLTGTYIWIAGIFLILLFSMISYFKLKKKLIGSIPLRKEEKGNVYQADYLSTAFVLGMVKPTIYLPSDLTEQEMKYVLRHEKSHIKRKDYIIKPIIFCITVIHWLNPFAWAAFLLAVKDMEMSCDEYVIKTSKEDIRKEYAAALMNLSAERKFRGVPLAFGEGDVKKRIKNVMSFKKPFAFVGICAGIGGMILAYTLLTNPDLVRMNNEALRASILNIGEDKEEVSMNDVVPFEWTSVYAFAPYLGREEQEAVLGFQSSKLQMGVSEGMMNLVFVNKSEVVSVICTYGEKVGYYMELGESESMMSGNKRYLKIDKEQNAVLHIARTENLIRLQAVEMPLQTEKKIPITTPIIDLSMGLGADGAVLDYAGNGIVIFHGYFGLFVYSIEEGDFIAAVDLEPIGCNYTQGDSACVVFVSADGNTVYLHSMDSKNMYVYDVNKAVLKEKDFSIEGKALFGGYADKSVLSPDHTVYRSENVIKFGEGENVYYGYLQSGSGTLEDLCYIEDDMVVPLFQKAGKEN